MVRNDGQVATRQVNELFRPMRRVGVEEKTVTRLHGVKLVNMTINDFALNHIQKLESFVLESWEDIRLSGERNKIRLDCNVAGIVLDRAQQRILMTCSGAPPLDVDSLASFYKARPAGFLKSPEERRKGDSKCPRDSLQRRERGRDAASLNLRQHADRHVRCNR
jgi:hypothetical protein